MADARSKKNSSRTKSTSGVSTPEKTSQLIDYMEKLTKLESAPVDPVQMESAPLESNPANTGENTREPLERQLEQRLNEISTMTELRLEEFFTKFDSRFNELLTSFQKSITTLTTSNFSTASERGDAEISKRRTVPDQFPDTCEMLTGWNSRKKQMLAELGVASEIVFAESSNSKKAGDTKTDNRPIPRLGPPAKDDALVALHESIESISSLDTLEIEDLKTQLTSKLRDAEVELSINRAKLSQQWAALEQRQFEVAQRESSLKSKYGNISESNKKPRLLDRLTRHLSGSSKNKDESK